MYGTDALAPPNEERRLKLCARKAPSVDSIDLIDVNEIRALIMLASLFPLFPRETD